MTDKVQLVTWLTPGQRDAVNTAAQAHNQRGNKSELVKALLAQYCKENEIGWPDDPGTWGGARNVNEK
jgi:hypothetical protein